MTDIVERLRRFAGGTVCLSTPTELEAADTIERLRAALVYEENRFNRVGTHGPDCYQWGPGHYECAMREIERLTEQLQTVFIRWQDEKESWRQELAEAQRNDQYSMKLLAESQAREANFQRTFRGHVYVKNEEWAGVNDQLRASQAREAKLQEEAKEFMKMCDWPKDSTARELKRGYVCALLNYELDDTALKEAIKQAKREALLEAADAMEAGAFDTPFGLRRMAGEME